MGNLPQHVAIIMDGNGRWASGRGMPRMAGHKEGLSALQRTIEYAVKKSIPVLSVFAFSTENWRRPKEEVTGLMQLFFWMLRNEVKKLHEHNVQLKIIGDISTFSKKLQQEIAKAEKLTEKNTGLKLLIAASYGGRAEIVYAARRLSEAVLSGDLKPQDIDESVFQEALFLPSVPEPDLFIRTSGELRISNFFLWQLAYTELYFTDVLWPDFNEAEFDKALEVFSNRQRRFGKIDNKVG